MHLRSILVLAFVLVVGNTGCAQPGPSTPTIKVYKSSNCECCGKWVDHVEEQGFKVSIISTDDVIKIKNGKGVPTSLRSCHTAEVGGYVVEGHVPASDIKRLLRDRPGVSGIAVAGMPIGSPGMEQGPAQRYEVIAFDKEGGQAIFARH